MKIKNLKKKKKTQCGNHDNQENRRIPFENNENYEVHRNSFDNNENHENLGNQ